jgi:hypothetical protein
MIKEIDGVKYVPQSLAIQLHTYIGFNKIFESKLSSEKTYLQSYEETEQLHVCIFKMRRYSGWQSFANARQRGKYHRRSSEWLDDLTK